ncbi:uncharacterized protein LOC142172402 [Nicotiana tabacum]|uniref:Uncharacterized protein LOC142172402 n=1 Tax=Nicotiana tabacum TaxID=4097 RepID=A0AC58T4J4_TOBAC
MIALIPKVDRPVVASQFRLISCCIVVYKCISKMICKRLQAVLQLVVNDTQAVFVQGRSMIQNVLIFHGLLRHYKRKTSPRCMMKIDMVRWEFIEEILQGSGFPRRFVSLVVTSTKFLVKKINNTTKALNTWSRVTFENIFEELKRLENLIRDLDENCMTNNILENRCELSKRKAEFIRYLKIHDSILSQKAKVKWFNKGDANTAYFHATIKYKRRKMNKICMRLVLNTLTEYEKISGQLINKNKNCFAMSTKTNLVNINRMKAIIGTKYQKLPIKYLGSPLTTGREKITFYSDIVNKVFGRTRGWHTKLLSSRGTTILIRHVLLDLRIHLLALVNPPKQTLELKEKFVARFFWSGQDSGGKYHWDTGKNLCYPHSEGGDNFRRLTNTLKGFRAK